MWSFGCVLGELLLGHPLFPGETTAGQFVEIVKLLGTPTPTDLKEMSVDVLPDMPTVAPMKFELVSIPPFPPSIFFLSFLQMFREGTDPDALDLASGLLCYSPVRRLTAAQAKQHRFFRRLETEKS